MPDGSTEMDSDTIYGLGLDFQELSKVMDEVGEAAAPEGAGKWAPLHFGGLDSARTAAASTMEVLTALGTSIGYVTTMADGISGALTGAAGSTQDVDQANAKTVTDAGGM